MYKIPIDVAQSKIDGKGVFVRDNTAKDTIVWIYTDGHDYTMTQDEFASLPQSRRDELHRIAYLSPWSKLWVAPPDSDPAKYTNHSNDHNLSVKYDPTVSLEPYFVANRDITAGEELTNNYREFDAITQTSKPEWTQ